MPKMDADEEEIIEAFERGGAQRASRPSLPGPAHLQRTSYGLDTPSGRPKLASKAAMSA
jgi:hypothetical protein